jgi:hypothetical protein
VKPGRKKSLNLVAVGAAVVFIPVYTVPTIQHAVAVDTCVEGGGRFDYESETCVSE